jgi:pyrimidine-nucleoside phosphorylase
LEIVREQEGDINFLENPDQYPAPKQRLEIKAETDGYLTTIHAREIGRLCMALGAGRKAFDDAVDYTAGMWLHKKVGDRVQCGEPLITLQSSGQSPVENFARAVQACFSIDSQPASPPQLLQKLLDARGIHPVEPLDN